MKILKVDDSHISVENSTVVTVAPQLGGGMLLIGLVIGFVLGKSVERDKPKRNQL